MSALNPEHVPKTMQPYWIIASHEPCSSRQQHALKEELGWEGLQPAELFGEGFSSIPELSRWAAHWALELLDAARIARGIEQQRRMAVEAYEDAKQDAMKSWIGSYYRRQAVDRG